MTGKNQNKYKPGLDLARDLALLLAGLALIVWMIWPQNVQANGGTIAAIGDKGPFNVTLSYSPSPPQLDTPVHLTLLLTRASSENPVTNANITVLSEMQGMGMSSSETPHLFQQNISQPNLYDVDVPVGMKGNWTFKIAITSPDTGQTSFSINVSIEKAAPPWGVIVSIMVALPTLAGLTWWFLFRNHSPRIEEE